jgi:hypothetical protein
MKAQKCLLFLLALSFLCLPHSSHAQAFQNLDFEAAQLTPIPSGQFGGSVPILSAIPDWTGFLGTTPVTQVLQNSFTLGNASIDILGPQWNFGGIIEGRYSVVLQPGRGPNGGGLPSDVSASISQTGLVPPEILSLEFKAEVFDSFTVSLGGQLLSIVPLATGVNYTLYGANIPLSMVGQNETLVVTALAGPNTTDYFDSFVFSPNLVPEPQTWSLLLFSAAVLALKRRQPKT